MRTPVAALVAVLVLALAPVALAGEKGMVSASGGVLKSEPKPKAKKGEKLKHGSLVDVVDHSPDGLWLKVSVNGQEGWVEKSYVRAMNRYGFSWERKDKSGGNQTVGKTTPPPAAATATPETGWVNGEATPAPGEGEWENEGEATPAASATPAPTEAPSEDGWGASEDQVDLTK